MKTIARTLMLFSLIVITLCILLWFASPEILNHLNNILGRSNNLLAYCTVLFTAIAIFIASMAVRAAGARPDLRLIITPRQGRKNEVALSVERDNLKVSDCTPYTSWRLELINSGKATAKYPFVEIEFNRNREIGENLDDFPGWENAYAVSGNDHHISRWAPGNSVVIYPGTGVQLPVMDFSGRSAYKGMQLKISIVADKMKKRTYSVPVKLMF